MTNRQYRHWRVTAQSTWKKSAASIVATWACMNCRQVVPVCRFRAGGIFRALRTRRMVDAPACIPSDHLHRSLRTEHHVWSRNGLREFSIGGRYEDVTAACRWDACLGVKAQESP